MLADENRRGAFEKQAQSATVDGKNDYMEKARELADSYSFFVQRKKELQRKIEESRSWFFTRDDAIYKLSMGAHEQVERVQRSEISNPVERTVLNCDKVLAAMNREVRSRQMECLVKPYREICAKIELFEIALRSLRGQTRFVAGQLFVDGKKQSEVVGVDGQPLSRRTVKREKDAAIQGMADRIGLYEGRRKKG